VTVAPTTLLPDEIAAAGRLAFARVGGAAKGSSLLDEFWKLSNVGKLCAGTTLYAKKQLSGAEPTMITRGVHDTIQLSSKVPGRVPGAYASYEKTVDASGKTIAYTKTTVAPDGRIVHVKDKLNP
jgi:hypothetical protein